jgi:25S rRNA (uracil2634-N3)-methyltransferase
VGAVRVYRRVQSIALFDRVVSSLGVMAKGRKPSLKAALSSAQSRLKKKKQAEDAAATLAIKQRAKVAGGKGGTANTQTRNPRRSTIPFKASDRILLIGEGNFSFAVALLQHPPTPLDYLPSANVVATTYDAEEECYTKYPDAEQNVRVLREKGSRVLFNVDATRLERTSALKGKTFDRIVWNFPHAGE